MTRKWTVPSRIPRITLERSHVVKLALQQQKNMRSAMNTPTAKRRGESACLSAARP